ncbi:MAG: RibD family protein [Burkholderiaceae bacterium]
MSSDDKDKGGDGASSGDVSDRDCGWALIRAAAAAATRYASNGRPAWVRLGSNGALVETSPADGRAELGWAPREGWRSLLPADDRRAAVVDLYLPIAAAHLGRPLVVGHLGQSLDGYIATAAGDSCFVTGPANIRHLHRMRALCDAVVIGAGTAAADDPRLTARLASGANPLRVIIDPRGRLDDSLRVFSDGAAPTLRACLPSAGRQAGERVLIVAEREGRFDLADLLAQLLARGCARIFVEGGGVTVSAFLDAGLLDRLHVAVAALLIGAGRPALRLPGIEPLARCPRPATRVFRMGADILHDCELAVPAPVADGDETLRRVL